MADFADFALWRYYFWELPRFWRTGRHRMPDCLATRDEPAMQAGAAHMRARLAATFTAVPDAEIARRASWNRLWRECGAYAAAAGSIPPPTITGLEHLRAAVASGRPVVALTGHVGNPYLACVALAQAGFTVFPVARSVDRSAATPLPVQWFLRLNYRATAGKLNGGRYLFTDYAGHFDRGVAAAARQPGAVLVNLIDMPAHLYAGKRAPVEFLGAPASLPANFVTWAIKRRAVLLTFWSGFTAGATAGWPPLWVRVEPPIDANDAAGTLQAYAERLGVLLAGEPWSWMGLPVAAQYHADANACTGLSGA